MDTYTAVINREEDIFVALCPETGTVSQGTSIEEATELYLEEFPLSHLSRSLITTFEVGPVASH